MNRHTPLLFLGLLPLASHAERTPHPPAPAKLQTVTRHGRVDALLTSPDGQIQGLFLGRSTAVALGPGLDPQVATQIHRGESITVTGHSHTFRGTTTVDAETLRVSGRTYTMNRASAATPGLPGPQTPGPAGPQSAGPQSAGPGALGPAEAGARPPAPGRGPTPPPPAGRPAHGPAIARLVPPPPPAGGPAGPPPPHAAGLAAPGAPPPPPACAGGPTAPAPNPHGAPAAPPAGKTSAAPLPSPAGMDQSPAPATQSSPGTTQH